MSKFQKGKSGNPAGRPKSENTVLREKLQTLAPEIFERLAEKVEEGDMGAIKLVMDRILPSLRPTAQQITLPNSGESLFQKADSVFSATVNGEVSADVSSQLITALAGMARIKEITELEQRIASLEEKSNES
jgi:hypothetical protein